MFLFYSTDTGLPRTPRYEPSDENKAVHVSPNVRQPAALYQRGPQYLPPFSSLFPVQPSTQQFVTNSSIEQMVKKMFDSYMIKNSTHLPPSSTPSPPPPPPLPLPPLPPLPAPPAPPAPRSECSSIASKQSGSHSKCKNFLFYLNNKCKLKNYLNNVIM